MHGKAGCITTLETAGPDLRTPPIHLESILHRCYPRVYRIALALCGDHDAAQAVVEQVVIRSGRISNRWETVSDADRWFLHYTVLQARESLQVSPERDVLLHSATSAETAALVSAVRQLPIQQREAFLLHHGEELDLRQLSTAMDCSSAAAANHLVSAIATLRKLTANHELDDFVMQLPGMMRKLVPADDVLEFQIRQLLARRRKWSWLRRLRKWLG